MPRPRLPRVATLLLVPAILLAWLTAPEGTQAQDALQPFVPGPPRAATAYETGWQVRVSGVDVYSYRLDRRGCEVPCNHTVEAGPHELWVYDREGSLVTSYPLHVLGPTELRVSREDRTWVQGLGVVGMLLGAGGAIGGGVGFALNADRSASGIESVGQAIVGFFTIAATIVGVALTILGAVGVAQPGSRASVEIRRPRS